MTGAERSAVRNPLKKKFKKLGEFDHRKALVVLENRKQDFSLRKSSSLPYYSS
jgi:hypothetical protein